jgi:NAD-dependent deacetylase
MPLLPELLPVAEKLAGAKRLFVLTGAGISAESGLPTFRGPDGLWRGHDPTRLASPEGFSDDPQLVWEFYNWRRQMAATVQPNAAHRALVALEKAGVDILVMTQNVDDLHERAGSGQIAKLHGKLFESRCSRCLRAPFADGPRPADSALPPICDQCGGPLRPNVVWFGESLSEAPFRQFNDWLGRGRVDGVLVVGTSAQFSYLYRFVAMARQSGAPVVEIHLDDASHMSADYFARAKAGEALPPLCEAIAGQALAL